MQHEGSRRGGNEFLRDTSRTDILKAFIFLYPGWEFNILIWQNLELGLAWWSIFVISYIYPAAEATAVVFTGSFLVPHPRPAIRHKTMWYPAVNVGLPPLLHP